MDSMRATLLGELSKAEDALVEKVWDKLATSGPYGALGELAAEDVRATTRWALGTFTACLLEGRGLTPAELKRLEEVGAARAGQGVGRAAVQQAFVEAHECCYRELAELAKRHPGAEAADELTSITLDLGELMRAADAAIMRGYDAAERLASSAPSNRFVDAVLTGAVPNDRLRAWAAELGVPVLGPWGLVAVTPWRREIDVLREAMRAVAAELPSALEGQIRANPALHGVLLVAGWEGHATAADDVLGPLARAVDVTLVPATARNLADVSETYRAVEQTVASVGDLCEPPALLSTNEGFLFAQSAHHPPELTETYVLETLDDLLTEPRARVDRLLETIRVVHRAGGSTGVAAARLCTTTRNVRYRLEQLEKLTGLDLRRADDLDRANRAAHLLFLRPDLLPSPDRRAS